jgi:hypothetical protein
MHKPPVPPGASCTGGSSVTGGPTGLGGAETGDLIGMRTAAWDAGEVGRAEAIDGELNRRLRVILRGRYAPRTRPAGPQAPVRTYDFRSAD